MLLLLRTVPYCFLKIISKRSRNEDKFFYTVSFSSLLYCTSTSCILNIIEDSTMLHKKPLYPFR